MRSQNTIKNGRYYLPWSLFVIINVLEFFLFKNYIAINVAPFYPASYDQTSILALSYRIYENIKHLGLISGIAQSEVLPTGVLFPLQAAIFNFFFGVSRFNALVPNFLYFILLQFFALVALRAFTTKNYLPLIFLGLLWCLQTPFLPAGNLSDFRMDFSAFCIYGIFIAAVIRGQLLLMRRWALLAGLIAGITILVRSITAVYLVTTLGLFFIYLRYHFKKTATDSREHHLTQQRLIHLLLASIPFACIILPTLWLNRVALYNYYVANHVIGEEKNIRALEEGVTTLFSRLDYYPKSLFLTHMGSLALVMTGGVLLVYLFLYRTANKKSSKIHSGTWKSGSCFLLLSFFVPLIILTADTIKSPVVGSILVPPFLFLLFWPCLYVDTHSSLTPRTRRLLTGLTSVVLATGIYHQVHELHHFPSKTKLRNGTSISQMYHDIGNYAVLQHWPRIGLSVDQICDYLTPQGIAILYYETHGQYLEIGIYRLGSSIFAIDKAAALESLNNSNVFIMNLHPYPPGSVYPFNQSVNALRPLLFKIAEKHFKRLGDYPLMDSTYRVYVKKLR